MHLILSYLTLKLNCKLLKSLQKIYEVRGGGERSTKIVHAKERLNVKE